MNDIKPIWQRPAKEVEEDEYTAFYKTFSKVRVPVLIVLLHTSHCVIGFITLKVSFCYQQDSEDPLSHIHFTAEGEVTFKSILFVPAAAPRGLFDEYGSKKNDFIKVFVWSVKLFLFILIIFQNKSHDLYTVFPAVCQKSFHHR